MDGITLTERLILRETGQKIFGIVSRKWDTTNEMRKMLMCLQERGITLADAQLHLDYLTGQIDEGNMESCVDNPRAKGCRLGIC
jgi:hypothetical protein